MAESCSRARAPATSLLDGVVVVGVLAHDTLVVSDMRREQVACSNSLGAFSMEAVRAGLSTPGTILGARLWLTWGRSGKLVTSWERRTLRGRSATLTAVSLDVCRQRGAHARPRSRAQRQRGCAPSNMMLSSVKQ